MRCLPLVFFCLALPLFCPAQKKGETQAGMLARKSFALAASNPDSALLLAKAGCDAAQKDKDAKGLASSLNSKGMAWYHLGNNDSAESNFLEAIAAYQAQRNTHDEARTLINLSALYTDRQRNEEAMRCIIRARKYMEAADDEAGKAYAEKMIGILYRQEGRYADAIVYLQSAMNNFRRIGQMNLAADAQSSLGGVYRMMGNADSAFYYYKAAFSYNTAQNNINGMAFASENIGDVYFARAAEQDNRWIDSSLRYYYLAFNLFKKLQSRQNIAYEKMMIGNMLMIKKQQEDARKYLREALQTFDSDRNFSYAFNTLDLLSQLEAASGHYKQAYDYARRELIYKDTVANSDRKGVMGEFFAKYEVEKRDRTIALLSAQKKLTMQELHHRRVLDIVYIVMALVAILIGVMLFNMYRVRQRLKEVQMRHQLSADLHDEVGSSLSSILLLSKMALLRKDDANVQQQMLGTIRQNAGEVIERMGDIVWTTDPKFDEVSSLHARMENYLGQVQQSTGVHIISQLSDDVANAQYPMNVRKNIFLIFKEAVNNVSKHADAATLNVFFDKEADHIILRITDDGKGFAINETQSGKGLETMQQRAEALGSHLNIKQVAGGGTSISLHIPARRYYKSRHKTTGVWTR